MIPKLIRTFATLIFAVCLAADSLAENWPGWRGPRGDGTSSDANVPLEWDGSSGKNIRWKTKLPGEGYSSPVIWGDRVFVGTCLPESKERVLVCVNRQNGVQLWQQTIFSGRLESKHALNSFASGTPATDGKTVFIAFLEVGDEQVVAPNVGGKRMIYPGQMVVAAFDMAGNHKWTVRPGGFLSAHGFCSNPVLFNDSVIINGDHDGDSYILALNKDTGETVWKTPRRHQTRSYVTPLLREIEGKTQMVLSGSKCVASFDPIDGSLNWHVEGPTEQFVASIVFDGENFFATGGYPTHHVIAIKPTGSGDVTKSHVSWHIQNVRCYVPSPVVVGNYLMVADDRGTANCFDAKSGERLWQIRLGKHYSTSLLAVNGLVYFIADDGVTKILRPGPQAEVLAENELGENVYSSPAVADGQLIVRSEEHLFCIARENAN